jgi:carboxyl-terminal processing protease
MRCDVERPPNGSWGKSLGVFLLVVTAFLAGGMAERFGWLPGGAGEPPGLTQTFRPFWEAWRLTEDYYVDREAVQPVRMTRGAIRGMLASLGDVGHTGYLSPEELRELQAGLKGEFEGVGAHMTIRKKRPTVMDVIPNSPAQAAGLKAGDVFVEVNGKPVSDLPLEKIVQMVRGPAGTSVKLRVLREGHAGPLDLTIQRGKVEVPSVSWRRLPGEPVAHLAIHSFGLHTDKELKEAVKALRAQSLRGVVIDVRGNPGGLKDQAVAVTSQFLKEGNVFIEQDARGRQTPVSVHKGGVATDLPLVVLTDEGTASSAEIFAGAIQDHARGKLVGTRTFGTGTVLEPFRLSDGGALMLAIAQWLTPKGRKIWHHGITPDFAVELPEGTIPLLPETEGDLTAEALHQSQDRQLLKALAVLKEQLR